MKFLIGLGLAILGIILFVAGVFGTQNVAMIVLGFLLGLLGMMIIRISE